MSTPTSPEFINPNDQFGITTQDLWIICKALEIANVAFNEEELLISYKLLQKFEKLIYNTYNQNHFNNWLKTELETPGGPKEI